MKNKNYKYLFIILLIAVSSIGWASPKTIRFQGRLTDNAGKPIIGTDVKVKFSIYSGASDPTPVWDSPAEQPVATNEAGLFATDIGPVNPDILSQYPDLYLQISVRDIGGLKPLLPRQHLTTVPFAIQADFAANAGLANDIKDNTISSLKIQSQAVTANQLAPKAVQNSNLADRIVTAVKIASNTITANEINVRTIQEVNLATDAVRSSNILDRSIEASKISSRTITATEIMPDTITSAEIRDHTIEAIDLDDNAIQLATGTVGRDQLKGGSVGSLQLDTDSVNTWNIKDGSIQYMDLAADAVRSSNILVGSIEGSRIATGTIVTSNIHPKAIQKDQIDDNAVTTDQIANQTIKGEDISNGAIAPTQISPGYALIPSGMIAMFASDCPANWTRFKSLDGKFPLGIQSYTGNPGGRPDITGLVMSSSGTHSHIVNPHYHGSGTLKAGPSLDPVGADEQDGGATDNWTNHTHPVSGNTGYDIPKNGNPGDNLNTNTVPNHIHDITSNGTWLPPYLGIVFCEKD